MKPREEKLQAILDLLNDEYTEAYCGDCGAEDVHLKFKFDGDNLQIECPECLVYFVIYNFDPSGLKKI